MSEPVPEEEIEALQKELQEQRVEIREQLAEDFGGEIRFLAPTAVGLSAVTGRNH